jgi:hypothetical protein
VIEFLQAAGFEVWDVLICGRLLPATAGRALRGDNGLAILPDSPLRAVLLGL